VHVVVIGGGPAGVSAALTSAAFGTDVTLIERGRVGGTALNAGPAPVRTLARAARLVRDWNSWDGFGLRGPKPDVDLDATLANATRVADYAHQHRRIGDHIRSQGVMVVEEAGDAEFFDDHTVKAPDGRTWEADRVVIAVGGRPARPPIPGVDLALTFEDIRSLQALPRRAVVIGASDTGCQLASILADFGCHVAVLQRGSRILSRADADVSDEMERAFRSRGIDVLTSASVERFEPLASGVRVVYRVGAEARSADVDAAFLATGWPGNADRINTSAAGVAIDDGYVVVDPFLRTGVPHIYAAGDIDGHSMLVSSALLEGRVAGENAVVGPVRRLQHEVVPAGSFTDPEYASVGLTEEEARATQPCAVAVARYRDLLRPVADGQPEGFCKLIVDAGTRRIVGAHVLGEYSAEVIQMVAACMAAGMAIEEVAELQFAFPTFTEGVSQAARMLVRDLGIRTMPQLWSSLDPRASAAFK